ncbi:hypothetical protein [Paenibacillus qinlingensis]|uniref:hypothetical protein n=1 Tax=Paenibacillus qinlingensis TaxID=1837343 RepID=UPI001C204E14|nr:hypothetical protein [Paenibacillus qinlingensis]
MKFLKALSVLAVSTIFAGALSGCTTNDKPTPSDSAAPSAPTASAPASNVPNNNAALEKLGLDSNLKFKDTRKIKVEIYDRGNPGGTKPENNFYTKYIKDGMLRDHNVDVTFVPVPRWTEGEAINNLLAGNQAPDISLTYSYPTIQTYANMGGVLDLGPLLKDNKDLLPDMWKYLTEANIYWDKDPSKGTLWAIESRLNTLNRTNTFVREDWLKKLNLQAPKTLAEFESMLKAFKDNASTLLGKDADKIIPFSTSFDVGWRTDHLTAAYTPNNITDKDIYTHDFDDRRFLYPNYKEGIKTLNKWYNQGLVWKDFALYPAGDKTEDNLMKAGYVGAFMHNWDYPYRNGADSIQAGLQKLVSPDAAYIAVEPFANDAGVYKKFLSGPVDRKIFFPGTNKEPIASLLYLNWISKLDNRVFLQFGEEGVTRQTLPDGSVKTIAATGEKIMNSPANIDYTITSNGLDLGDPAKTVKSIANGYAGIDAKYIEKANQITTHDGRVGKNANVGAIKAENGQGQALKEKRDTLLNKAVVAPVDKFDAVYDGGMKDYLNSGGQAIIDERTAAWEKSFGKETTLK